MRRIAAYTAAAALLMTPWLTQHTSAPAPDRNLAICVDPHDAAPSNIAPVALLTPLSSGGETVAAPDLVLACGSGGSSCVPVLRPVCR